MVHIPSDIWTSISDFLPDHVLRRLLAVNSTFHHIALDVRYREVTVRELISAATEKQLQRLQDPYVAKRVRCLNLHLDKNKTYFLNWRALYAYDAKRNRRPPVTKLSHEYAPQTAIDAVIHSLTDLITGLPNINALGIYANDEQLAHCCRPVFAAAWATFGANLRRISLHGLIYHLPEPLSIPDFSQLRELHLSFTDVFYPEMVPPIHAHLCETLPPALNRLCPVIESLSVSFGADCPGYLDLAELFNRLDRLPRLKKFLVDMPCPKFTLGEFPFKRLLHDHARTLRHTTLKLNGFNVRRTMLEESRLLLMMSDLLGDETLLVDLESFEFSPTIPRAFEIMLTYLARSADTLTSLTLVDQYLTHEEVAMLATVFFHRVGSLGMQTLVLNVKYFGPRLLTLLATSFSGLRLLDLRCFDWGVEDSTSDYLSLFQRLDVFRTEMMENRAIFTAWEVREVTVLLGEKREPPRWPRFISKMVVAALAECIPNAHCSWGIQERELI